MASSQEPTWGFELEATGLFLNACFLPTLSPSLGDSPDLTELLTPASTTQEGSGEMQVGIFLGRISKIIPERVLSAQPC